MNLEVQYIQKYCEYLEDYDILTPDLKQHGLCGQK